MRWKHKKDYNIWNKLNNYHYHDYNNISMQKWASQLLLNSNKVDK